MRQELIAGILLAIISAVIFFFPQKVWKIAESWKNKDKVKPSDSYTVVLRCVAIVFFIVAIVIMF